MFHRSRRQPANSLLIDVAGWYGVAAILGSYALLQFGLLSLESIAYQFLNLTGAVTLGVEAWSKRDAQPVVLNLIWGGIAFLGLLGLSI